MWKLENKLLKEILVLLKTFHNLNVLGKVYSGKYGELVVALKENIKSNTDRILAEAKLLKKLKHVKQNCSHSLCYSQTFFAFMEYFRKKESTLFVQNIVIKVSRSDNLLSNGGGSKSW